MLILSVGQEIVLNPLVYFDPEKTRVGVEMANYRAMRDFPDAEVISASVQSIVNRLEDYDPEAFGTIVVDEAHHSPAPTYRKVIKYFKPSVHLVGFTATPKRTDGVRLNDIYSDIVYQKDLRWAINNGRLCEPFCRKVSIDVDLRGVHRKKDTVGGETDFVQAELNRAMAKSAPRIVEIYNQYAFGPTVINVSSVNLAYEVAEMIPNAVAVTGEMSMDERESILSTFRAGKIQCLVSVNVLKEGVDIPNITTIIMARPTLSSLLYTQIVGRGLRLYPGKKFLNLIDIEGILGPDVSLCSALTLLGIEQSTLPKQSMERFNGINLMDMDEIADELSDTPESWALNAKAVDAWADTSGYDLHSVNWYRMPDGSMYLSFPIQSNRKGNYVLTLPPPDAMGMTQLNYARMPVQVALDLTAERLVKAYQSQRQIWDRALIEKTWGPDLASPKQLAYIQAKLPNFDTTDLTKAEANCILRRITQGGTKMHPWDAILPVMPKRSQEEERAEPVTTLVLPAEYVQYAQEKTMLKEYSDWLERSVMSVYRQEKNDLDRLIERINHSNKTAYGSKFISYQRKYRYICGLKGRNVSRRDMVEWLAKRADILIPRIIAANIVEPGKYKTVRGAKPDMTKPPYNAIKLTYPESAAIISGKNKGRLPTTAKDIKEKAKERWAATEKKKETRKRKKKEAD